MCGSETFLLTCFATCDTGESLDEQDTSDRSEGETTCDEADADDIGNLADIEGMITTGEVEPSEAALAVAELSLEEPSSLALAAVI